MCRSFYPCGVGWTTLLLCGCAHQPRSSPNLTLLGFLWRSRHTGLLTALPTFSLTFEGGWCWKCQASDYGLAFLVMGPHPGVIQEPTKSTHENQRHSFHPGNSKRFKSLVSDAPITEESAQVLRVESKTRSGDIYRERRIDGRVPWCENSTWQIPTTAWS